MVVFILVDYMKQHFSISRKTPTITALAAAMFAATLPTLAADQKYMVKIPISKLSQLQSTEISVAPSPVAFPGDVALGVAAQAITVQVRNSGFSPITGIVPSLTDGASDFTLENKCPSTLTSMASCTLTLGFKPTAVGARTGNLAVSSSAKNGLQLVPITGSGMAPDATLTANTFSATQINTTSSSTLVLANSSTAALRLTPTPLTGDFSLAGGSCSSTLAAGANCTYAVDFRPTTTGAKTGTFKVSLGVGSYSFERTATLQANAQGPTGTLSAIDFGASPAGAPVLREATLTNTGVGPLALGTPMASGAGFSIASGGSCAGTLAKDASCTVKVQLLPAGTSAHTGTLSVPVQDASPLTASLAGQSQLALLSAISPASRAFGSIAVGASSAASTHTLTNSGNIAATGLTYTAPGGFGITQGGCTNTLAAGASCQFTTTFSPSQAQAYAGNATVASANAGTQLVALTGTGAQSKATLTSPAALSLADWYQAGTITGAHTYRNDGNAPMTLTSPSLASPLSITGNSCTGVAPGSSCDITVALTRNVGTGGSGSQTFTAAGAGVAPSLATTNWSIYTVIPNWSSPTLAFGNVQAGQTATKSITLTNNGSVAGNWAANSALSNLPAGFTADLTACANVAPGSSCAVNFTFSPTQAQAYGGAGVAPAYASILGNTLTLSGSGAAQAATVTDIDFGNVAAGSTKDLVTTITNPGVGPLSLTAPTAGSITGAAFTLQGTTCTSSLAASSSCTVTVRYTATGTAAASGTLSLGTGAGSKTVNLAGQSQQALLSAISPATRAFDKIPVGSSITSPKHTLTNIGNIAATGLTYTAPAGFSIVQGGCGTTLAAGASCDFMVIFQPTLAQAYGANAIIASSNAGTQHLALTGSAVQSRAVLISAASQSLSDWYQPGTLTKTFTYRNDGNSGMTLASPTLSSPLSVASNACSGVAPGASCDITVALTRNANTGGSGSQSFTPSGAGIAPAQATASWSIFSTIASWTPTWVDFGDIGVNQVVSRTVKLSNSGSVAADWRNLGDDEEQFDNGESIDTSKCGSVAPGGSCDVTIQYSPNGNEGYFGRDGIGPRTASIRQTNFSYSGQSKLPFEVSRTSMYGNVTAICSKTINCDWSTAAGAYIGDWGRIDIRNTGTQPLTITESDWVSFSGGRGTARISGQGCTWTPLLPGQTCSMGLEIFYNDVVYNKANYSPSSIYTTIPLKTSAGNKSINVYVNLKF